MTRTNRRSFITLPDGRRAFRIRLIVKSKTPGQGSYGIALPRDYAHFAERDDLAFAPELHPDGILLRAVRVPEAPEQAPPELPEWAR